MMQHDEKEPHGTHDDPHDSGTATEIIEQYAGRKGFGFTDWAEIEDCLDPCLAEALLVVWRADVDEPWFNQPSRSLVQAVELMLGEDVWEQE